MEINVPGSLYKYISPLMAYRFLVEVDGSAVGAFTRFSGIKMEVQTIQARSGNDNRGVQEYVPVLSSFQPVTLTRGVFKDNEFLDWLFSAAAGPYGGPSGKMLERTINVVALDDKGSRAVVWTLMHAMPIGYEVSPMDSNRSEVLSESVTFAIRGVERNVSSVTLVSGSTGGSVHE